MSADSFSKQKTETHLSMWHWILISSCFSFLLVCTRMTATGQFTYTFLIWNLFLAFIPYAISGCLYHSFYILSKTIRWLLIFVWLLFIPNSFYIITDLFHLEQFDNAPKWFDLLLLFSFAWNGLLMGLLSLRKVEIMIRLMVSHRLLPVIIFVVMWLNAFGIYIGRFLRYNSWDIFTNPLQL